VHSSSSCLLTRPSRAAGTLAFALAFLGEMPVRRPSSGSPHPRVERGIARQSASPGNLASLLDADRTIGTGDVASLRNALLADVRVNREGTPPMIGADGQALLARWAATLRSEPTGGEVARSGEFGYTYGSYTATRANAPGSKEQGSYVRIWRKRPDGRWGIALDIVNPHPPGQPSS
jgi:hypothetical protein